MADASTPAADFHDVVARWNPSGLARVRAALSHPGSAMCVLGQQNSGFREEAELVAAALSPAPHLDFGASAAQAALALLVVDASSPVGRHEVETIRTVSELIPVLVILTEIDAYRDWKRVADHDAELLRLHLRHSIDISIWPVSVRWSAAARASDQRASDQVGDRTTLAAMAGFGAVVQRLSAAASEVGPAADLRRYHSAVVSAGSGARRALVDKARDSADTHDAVRLRAERAAIAATRDFNRTERANVLRSRIQRAKVDLVHAAGNELRQVSAAARSAIDRVRGRELEQFPDELAHLIDGGVARIAAMVGTRLASIHTEVLGTEVLHTEVLGSEPSTVVNGAALIGTVPHRVVSPPWVRPKRGVEDRVMILVGASAGVSVGRLAASPLALVPALDIASIPLTFVLGGLFAGWITRARGVAASRNHMRAWVTESVVHAKSGLEQWVLAEIFEAETRIDALLDAAAHASSTVRERRLVEIDMELRSRADIRSRFMASCDRDLMVLDRGLAIATRAELVSSTEPIGAAVRPTV